MDRNENSNSSKDSLILGFGCTLLGLLVVLKLDLAIMHKVEESGNFFWSCISISFSAIFKVGRVKDYLVLEKVCSRTFLNPEQLKWPVLKQTVLRENVILLHPLFIILHWSIPFPDRLFIFSIAFLSCVCFVNISLVFVRQWKGIDDLDGQDEPRLLRLEGPIICRGDWKLSMIRYGLERGLEIPPEYQALPIPKIPDEYLETEWESEDRSGVDLSYFCPIFVHLT